MKPSFLLLFFLSVLVISCQDQKTEHQLIVEASITSGQNDDSVRVKVATAEVGYEKAQLVSNAQVKLLSQGITYYLEEEDNNPGYYSYRGSDLTIVAGREYMLWVAHEDVVEVTSTIIKADTMVKSELENDLSFLLARN